MPDAKLNKLVTQAQKNNTDYPLMREYYRQSGSWNYYINEKVQEARDDNAPQNAIHKNSDGTWLTPDSEETKNPWVYRHLGLPIPERLHFGASISVNKYFADQAARNDFVDKLGDYLRDVWGFTSEDFWIRTENNDVQ